MSSYSTHSVAENPIPSTHLHLQRVRLLCRCTAVNAVCCCPPRFIFLLSLLCFYGPLPLVSSFKSKLIFSFISDHAFCVALLPPCRYRPSLEVTAVQQQLAFRSLFSCREFLIACGAVLIPSGETTEVCQNVVIMHHFSLCPVVCCFFSFLVLSLLVFPFLLIPSSSSSYPPSITFCFVPSFLSAFCFLRAWTRRPVFLFCIPLCVSRTCLIPSKE